MSHETAYRFLHGVRVKQRRESNANFVIDGYYIYLNSIDIHCGATFVVFKFVCFK